MSNKLKAGFIVSLFATMLLGNGIIALQTGSILPQDEKNSESGIVSQLNNSNASTGQLGANKELPQVEMIRIKTAFEQNEITIRLASEQACKYVGLDNKECQEDLVGIAYTETRSFNCQSYGDSGLARGCFQIHRGYHPEITVAQAEDPYWAAIWTIKRMVNSYGYPKNRETAIRGHNGNPYKSTTLKYFETVNSFVKM